MLAPESYSRLAICWTIIATLREMYQPCSECHNLHFMSIQAFLFCTINLYITTYMQQLLQLHVLNRCQHYQNNTFYFPLSFCRLTSLHTYKKVKYTAELLLVYKNWATLGCQLLMLHCVLKCLLYSGISRNGLAQHS